MRKRTANPRRRKWVVEALDHRNPWCRRKDILQSYLADTPDASTKERDTLRGCAVIKFELERLEYWLAINAERHPFPETISAEELACLDQYSRAFGNFRRGLEAVGLERRTKDITPRLQEYLHHKAQQNGAGADIVVEGSG
jgi:hypothetical protein